MKLFLAIFLSAILAVLSHPIVIAGYAFPNLGFLAWIAYIPLFLATGNKGGKLAWGAAFGFHLLFFSGSMYWLYVALNTFGRLSLPLSILILGILIIFLSAYLALLFPLSLFLERSLRIPRFWSMPLLWVAVEWCRTHWPLGGFPWGQVGYSQAGYSSLIQMADVTGVYGLTAWVIWINLAGVEILQPLFQRSRSWKRIGFAAMLLLFSFIYGRVQIELIPPFTPSLKVGLIQGDISQDEKWLDDKSDEIIQTYQHLTDLAVKGGAELVIWPEAAYPFELALDDPQSIQQINLSSKDLLLGAVSYESQGRLPRGISYTPPGYPIHNSALLIKKTGEVDVYHKQHLVPYGEYVPLREILPFLNKLTAQMGTFQRGNRFNSLHSGSVSLGMLICYEDIFPEVARGHALAGANLLVNLTNDAWYGNTSALPQHLNFSILRAVETKRSLIRSTNTGITATIDPWGRVKKTLPVYRQDVLWDDVPLLSSSTFYIHYGDLFARGCLAISLSLLMIAGITCLKNFTKKSKA